MDTSQVASTLAPPLCLYKQNSAQMRKIVPLYIDFKGISMGSGNLIAYMMSIVNIQLSNTISHMQAIPVLNNVQKRDGLLL